jgi:hypothetical protein
MTCRFRLTLPRGNLAPSGAGTAPKTAGCGEQASSPALPRPARHHRDRRGTATRHCGARTARTCRQRGPSVAVRETADGAHRPRRRPTPVRHASVDTATQRPAALQDDTRWDREETARQRENSQLAGRFRRWWQVLGSNQRRASRRFYSRAHRGWSRSREIFGACGRAAGGGYPVCIAAFGVRADLRAGWMMAGCP